MRFFPLSIVGLVAVFGGANGASQMCSLLSAYGGGVGNYAAKAGDFLATALSRFAPDDWLQAYAQIPATTRQCIMRYKMTNELPKFLMSQPLDAKQINAEQQQQCAQGYDKVTALLQIVARDVGRMTPKAQQIFGQLFQSLFQGGLKAFPTAFANYQASWLTAQPSDQQQMEVVFPKLGFFFNGAQSIPATQQALKLAQGDWTVLPDFLTTMMKMGAEAAFLAPVPDQTAYAPLHTALQQDYGFAAQMFGQAVQQMCAPGGTGSGGVAQGPPCVDQAGNCAQLAAYCTNPVYQSQMALNCKKTCGQCGGVPAVAPAPVVSPTCVDATPSCVQWAQQGVCQSTRFTTEQKRQYCGKTCGLC